MMGTVAAVSNRATSAVSLAMNKLKDGFLLRGLLIAVADFDRFADKNSECLSRNCYTYGYTIRGKPEKKCGKEQQGE